MLLLSTLALAGELAVGIDVAAPRTAMLSANDRGEERDPTGSVGAGLSADWRWKDRPVSGALRGWAHGGVVTWAGRDPSTLIEGGVDVLVSGRPAPSTVEWTLEAGGGPEVLHGFHTVSFGLHGLAGVRVGLPKGVRPWVGVAVEGTAAPRWGYTLTSYPSSSYSVGGLGVGAVWSVGMAI